MLLIYVCWCFFRTCHLDLILNLRIVCFRARESHAGSALLLQAQAGSRASASAGAKWASAQCEWWDGRMRGGTYHGVYVWRLEGAALPNMERVDAFNFGRCYVCISWLAIVWRVGWVMLD